MHKQTEPRKRWQAEKYVMYRSKLNKRRVAKMHKDRDEEEDRQGSYLEGVKAGVERGRL